MSEKNDNFVQNQLDFFKNVICLTIIFIVNEIIKASKKTF